MFFKTLLLLASFIHSSLIDVSRLTFIRNDGTGLVEQSIELDDTIHLKTFLHSTLTKPVPKYDPENEDNFWPFQDLPAAFPIRSTTGLLGVKLPEEHIPEATNEVENAVRTPEAVSDTVHIISEIMPSVLRIHVTIAEPDFSRPWTIKNESQATGSGFPIRDKLIITNAHVTNYAHSIHVEKPGFATRFKAYVVAEAHDPDLCVLKVEDDSFWENLNVLELVQGAEPIDLIPKTLDGVFVVGYPTGGNSLSVTEGIVSRVEVGYYAYSSAFLLEIQIDAAINPGNSGGPVFNKDGKVVGVAFQGLQNADSIGYIIPVPIVNHVLEDVKRNGKYTGMVSLGATLQSLQNPMLKDYVGMINLTQKLADKLYIDETGGAYTADIGEDGVLVTSTDSQRTEKYKETNPLLDINGNPARNIGLEVGDVLLALDGQSVASNGSIYFRHAERVELSYLLIGRFEGETLEGVVLRNNKIIITHVPLEVPIYKVAPHAKGEKPRYIIFGASLFVPLTKQYVRDTSEDKLDLTSLVRSYQSSFVSAEQKEIVLLSRIFSSSNTDHYNISNVRILSVDGKDVRSLSHLNELLSQESNKEFFEFKLASSEWFVIRKSTHEQSTKTVVEQYKIHPVSVLESA